MHRFRSPQVKHRPTAHAGRFVLQQGLLLGLLPLLAGGCGDSDGGPVDPNQAAEAAMDAYDKNGDGQLNDQELAAAPALRDGKPRADANSDGQLSADEIAQRIEAWQQSPRKLINTPLVFTVRGRPVAGADVTVRPAPFLEQWLPTSQGKTDSVGSFTPVVSRELPGMPHGYYHVEASFKQGGKERLPATANTESELGVELCADRNLVESNFEIRFELKPRRR